MSKISKIFFMVVGLFLCLSFAHLWLNIGFDKLGIGRKTQTEDSFRVGFLPVT